MSDQPSETFHSWGLLELFGHQRLTDELSEQTISGCHFIRINVPEVGTTTAYTRYFTQNTIYDMTPINKTTTRKLTNYLRSTPMNAYELREAPTAPLLTANTVDNDNEVPY